MNVFNSRSARLIDDDENIYKKLVQLIKNVKERNSDIQQPEIYHRIRKHGTPCCTSFTSVFNKCCCHWLDDRMTEFDFKYTKSFRTPEGDNWSCNSCSRGYICSDNESKNL